MAKSEIQTKIDPSAEFAAMIAKAKDLPEIYPKLDLGGKTDERTYDLVFEEDQPRFAEFEDQFTGGTARAMFLNVRVVAGPKDIGSIRSLPMPAKVDHGLTRAVLGIAKKHGNRLKGVSVRLETRNYKHKKYGMTRGFTVTEISMPTDVPSNP